MATATRRRTKATAADLDTNDAPGKSSGWLCEDCDEINDEHDPRCQHCEHGYNPDLIYTDCQLLAVVAPNRDEERVWRAMRDCPTSTDLIRSHLRRILKERGNTQVDSEPVCWRVTGDDVGVWFQTREPSGKADLENDRLAQAVRDLFFIPHSVEPKPSKKKQPSLAAAAAGEVFNPIAELERRRNGKAAPKGKKAPEVPSAADVPAAEERDIPIAEIVVGDLNPRIVFDEEKLRELADSLKKHGQLQNLVVYRQPDGKFGLIAGERRYRAAKLAKLPSMRCKVLDVTEAQAVELCGIENLVREDLSAIEAARWYQSMLARCGYTQETLAARIGVSQPTVANRLRLLQLPDAWQERVIRREITESHARELVPWADLPAVLQALEGEIKAEGLPALNAWRNSISTTLERHSRRTKKGAWYHFNVVQPGKQTEYRSGQVALTPKDVETHKAELDVRDVPSVSWDGKVLSVEPRAFNLDVWWELQSEREAKAKEREEARAEGGAKKKDKPLDPKAAAAAEADRKRKSADVLKKRIAGYRTEWLKRAIAARVQNEALVSVDQLLQILLWFASIDGHQGRRHSLVNEAVGELLPTARRALAGNRELVLHEKFGELVPMAGAARKAIAALMQLPSEDWRSDLPSHVVPDLAAVAGVDLVRDWEVDEAFCKLHTTDQLAAQAREWKVQFTPRVKKHGEMMGEIILWDQASSKKLPAPKALAKG